MQAVTTTAAAAGDAPDDPSTVSDFSSKRQQDHTHSLSAPSRPAKILGLGLAESRELLKAKRHVRDAGKFLRLHPNRPEDMQAIQSENQLVRSFLRDMDASMTMLETAYTTKMGSQGGRQPRSRVQVRDEDTQNTQKQLENSKRELVHLQRLLNKASDPALAVRLKGRIKELDERVAALSQVNREMQAENKRKGRQLEVLNRNDRAEIKLTKALEALTTEVQHWMERTLRLKQAILRDTESSQRHQEHISSLQARIGECLGLLRQRGIHVPEGDTVPAGRSLSAKEVKKREESAKSAARLRREIDYEFGLRERLQQEHAHNLKELRQSGKRMQEQLADLKKKIETRTSEASRLDAHVHAAYESLPMDVKAILPSHLLPSGVSPPPSPPRSVQKRPKEMPKKPPAKAVSRKESPKPARAGGRAGRRASGKAVKKKASTVSEQEAPRSAPPVPLPQNSRQTAVDELPMQTLDPSGVPPSSTLGHHDDADEALEEPIAQPPIPVTPPPEEPAALEVPAQVQPLPAFEGEAKHKDEMPQEDIEDEVEGRTQEAEEAEEAEKRMADTRDPTHDESEQPSPEDAAPTAMEAVPFVGQPAPSQPSQPRFVPFRPGIAQAAREGAVDPSLADLLSLEPDASKKPPVCEPQPAIAAAVNGLPALSQSAADFPPSHQAIYSLPVPGPVAARPPRRQREEPASSIPGPHSTTVAGVADPYALDNILNASPEPRYPNGGAPKRRRPRVGEQGADNDQSGSSDSMVSSPSAPSPEAPALSMGAGEVTEGDRKRGRRKRADETCDTVIANDPLQELDEWAGGRVDG
ncbi:unnamed protein product [Vitrella brassicaformis CCMP3155]|uniref:Uncharacterized protein n=1 Tax=Vitrella brassicaformis (strain CCMP3155) TaxID=1169540 RepID=A0A0G4H7H0_VITBC|nr:unnamed protein product [Vitrella brassicaformis CCMP3155]|eukprot:CEM39697.1 unnamed protein product [Vitrella brassicaformis CCMP3155]